MDKKELTLKELILEIKSIFGFLFSKWKIITITGIIGASLGLCISVFSNPNYVSSLKFVIDEQKKGAGGLASLASSFGLGGVAGETSLFSSPSVILEELVKNLEISKMNLLNETPIINIIDEPIYPLTVERLRKIKGILIGGIISGFTMVIFLLVRRFFKNLGV